MCIKARTSTTSFHCRSFTFRLLGVDISQLPVHATVHVVQYPCDRRSRGVGMIFGRYNLATTGISYPDDVVSQATIIPLSVEYRGHDLRPFAACNWPGLFVRRDSSSESLNTSSYQWLRNSEIHAVKMRHLDGIM